MKVQLKVEGNKAAIKAIDAASKQAVMFLEEEIHATGEDILIKAQGRAPVKYSVLKNSGYNLKEPVKSTVGFNAFYSPYVEFGTGSEVDIPPGLENYAMEFYVSGNGRLPANPFLFNSAFEEQQALIERLTKAFNGT